MLNNPLKVNVRLNNEHLYMEIESQDDITLYVEFLERFFKKNNKNKVAELKEVQVSEIGPRKPTQG